VNNTWGINNAGSHTTDGGTPPYPVAISEATNFSLVPLEQLDPVDGQYDVIVTLTHTEGTHVVMDYTNIIGPQQLLELNGELYFGSILTYFTNLDSAPDVTNTVPGEYSDCLLAVSAGAGWIPEAPGHTYGNGSYIPVILLTNGTAEVQNGVVVNVQGPASDTGSISNITFTRSGVTLSSTGAACAMIVNYPI